MQATRDLAGGSGASLVVVAAASTLLALFGGAAVFVAGFPERLAPTTFDLVGSSHQLMHVGAILAHAAQYVFLWEMLSRQQGHAPGATSALLRGWCARVRDGVAAQQHSGVQNPMCGPEPAWDWTALLASLISADSA